MIADEVQAHINRTLDINRRSETPVDLTPPESKPPMTSLPPAASETRAMTAPGEDRPITTLAAALSHNLDVIMKATSYGKDLIVHLSDPAVAGVLEAAIDARRSGVSPLVLDAAAAGIRHVVPPAAARDAHGDGQDSPAVPREPQP